MRFFGFAFAGLVWGGLSFGIVWWLLSRFSKNAETRAMRMPPENIIVAMVLSWIIVGIAVGGGIAIGMP